ncbi:MAG: HEAT repeat domain-containing protein [Planctomycetes bacterium]|nr:HEAT repeat domain-containing protein [Planctomycetota bacterium]
MRVPLPCLAAAVALAMLLPAGCRHASTARRQSPRAAEAEPRRPLPTAQVQEPVSPEVEALLAPRLGELKTLAEGDDEDARAAAAEELARIGAPALSTLTALAGADRLETRAQAARALGLGRIGGAVPSLVRLLGDPSWMVRAQAAEGLGRLGDATRVPELVAALDDAEWRVRVGAARGLAALGEVAAPEGAVALARLAQDVDPDIRFAALVALTRIPGEASNAALRRELTASDPELLALAADALATRRDPAAFMELGAAVDSGPPERRRIALRALAHFDQPLPAAAESFVRELIAALVSDEDGDTARRVLRDLGRSALGAFHERLLAGPIEERRALLPLLAALGDASSREPLLRCYREGPAELRAETLRDLVLLFPQGLEDLYAEAARSTDLSLATEAFTGLSLCEGPRSEELLLSNLAHDHEEWRLLAARALQPRRKSPSLRGQTLERLAAETSARVLAVLLSCLPPPPDVEVTAGLLARLPKEADPERQGYLVVALGQYRGPGTAAALQARVENAEGALALQALEALASDPDPSLAPLFLRLFRDGARPTEVRGRALRAALRADGPDLRAALREALSSSSPVLAEAGLAGAIALVDEEALIETAKRPGAMEVVRFQALEALGRTLGAKARAYLLAAARDEPSEPCRAAAVRALAGGRDPTLLPALLEATANEKSTHVRQALALPLGLFQDPRALAALLGLAADPDPLVRGDAASAFGLIQDAAGVAPLLKLLGDPVAAVRLAALEALVHLDPPAARTAMFAMLADAEAAVRRVALACFGRSPDPRVVPHLLQVAAGLSPKEPGLPDRLTTAEYLRERGLPRLARHAYLSALDEVLKVPFLERRVHVRLGFLEMEEGRFREASGHFERALRLVRETRIPGETPEPELEAWGCIAKGIAEMLEGRARSGIEHVELGLRSAAGKPEILNDLAMYLADRKLELERAQRFAEWAAAARPNDAAVLDTLGWVEYRRGNLDGAVLHLRRALELAPEGVLHYHLAAVLTGKGERAEGLEELRRAGELDRELLERARTDPDLAPLAREPGFEAAVRRLGE